MNARCRSIAISMMVLVCAMGRARADAPTTEADEARAAILDAIARGDVDALAARVVMPLRVWVWAPTSPCRTRLRKLTITDTAGLKAAMPCLAALGMKPATRRLHRAEQTTAMIEPGVRVSLTLQRGDDGVLRLALLTTPLHADDPAIPSLDRERLEAHRVAGTPDVAPDDAARAVDQAAPRAHLDASFTLCLDRAGKVSSVTAVDGVASYLATARAAIATWSFRPFVVNGKPVPVCAPLELWSPHDLVSLSDGAFNALAPAAGAELIEGARVSGNPQVAPDDKTKVEIQQAHVTRLIANVRLCVGTTGHVLHARTVTSSGFPAYDRELEAEVLTWKYTPFQLGGTPVTACVGVTFVYQQH